MQYSISEEITGTIEWSDVRYFRPTSSHEKMRRNLECLAVRSVKLRKFTVYYDKLPSVFVECCHGEIVYERFAGHVLGYFKKEFGEEKEEREYCQDHENKRRLKRGFSYGRNSSDLTSWILKAPESEKKEKRYVKKAYVPRKKKFNIRRRNGKETRIKAKRRRKVLP